MHTIVIDRRRWLTEAQIARLPSFPPPQIPLAQKRICRLRKPMAPSVWAETHRVLPRDAAEAGPWRNDKVPYLAGIMDASFYRTVQEIVVCAAPQTGKSEMNYTCLGYAVDRRPGNALVVFPDEDTAKTNAADRIVPMLKDSPRLRQFFTGVADDVAAKKIRLKSAILYMAWANSASQLANKPLPYVVLDEEDKYPITAGKREASPADLAKKRTRTFSHMRKVWRTSSPSIETGPIWRALTQECQLVFDFWVRCPQCGAWQIMVFDRIKWPDDLRDPLRMKDERACWYACPDCPAQWDDADRNLAVRAGQWRDRDEGRTVPQALDDVRPVTIGFHIPSWLCPFVELWEVALAFLETRGGKDLIKLRDFRNAHQALPWESVSAERSEDRILALADERPRGVVPGGGVVVGLIGAVDTQDDGFWYEIRAFGYGVERESWCVSEGKLPTFEALVEVLWNREYTDADGKRYPVARTLIDSGGHRTQEVYDFCRAHRGRITPTKGVQRMTSPHAFRNLDHGPNGKLIPGGLRLYRINTSHWKDTLAGVLEIEPGDPGCWWYHRDVTVDWARQMTVEGLDEKGVWVNPHGRANHAWDCAVLLLAAHDIFRVSTEPRPVERKKTKSSASPAVEKINLW